MLTIRLQRTGTKNKPAFRIVLAEKARSASKKFLEVLGHYNPRSKDFGIKDPERLKYWVNQHVELSPTVHNLLIEKKLVEGKKVKAWAGKKKEGEASTEAPKPAAAPVEVKAAEVPTETPAA
jgi:small subunit ribosomal protein S16